MGPCFVGIGSWDPEIWIYDHFNGPYQHISRSILYQLDPEVVEVMMIITWMSSQTLSLFQSFAFSKNNDDIISPISIYWPIDLVRHGVHPPTRCLPRIVTNRYPKWRRRYTLTTNEQATPLKIRQNPKRKRWYSTHPFSGALTVSSRGVQHVPRPKNVWYVQFVLGWIIKGQSGVPLTVYPWYLLCSLGILGDYNP